MVNLEGMTMKELREIARSYGISYISERRKADLVRLIHQADKWRHYVVARGQARGGLFPRRHAHIGGRQEAGQLALSVLPWLPVVLGEGLVTRGAPAAPGHWQPGQHTRWKS